MNIKIQESKGINSIGNQLSHQMNKWEITALTLIVSGWLLTEKPISQWNRGDPWQWRHNGRDGVSNRQPHHCLLHHLFRRRPKKTPKLRATGHCVGNSPVTGEFLTQMASNAENVSIWWRHHILNPCQHGIVHRIVLIYYKIFYVFT